MVLPFLLEKYWPIWRNFFMSGRIFDTITLAEDAKKPEYLKSLWEMTIFKSGLVI